MFRQILLGTIICLCGNGLSFGQGFPQPGPEHEKLRELEGKWDCVIKAGDQESKGTATYKSICEGMWVESDFEGDIGSHAFHGHGLDGYDLTKKKYVAIWVDSMSSAPLRLEGDFDAAKKVLVMTGESTGPDGKQNKVKTIIENKDKNHFTFKMFMVLPDDKEQLMLTIDYTRRK